MLLGLYLGLRAFEIAQVRWEDFSFEFRRFHVVGKGAKSATLAVPEPLRQALEARGASAGFLFPGRIDGHVHPATIRLWARRFAAEHGVTRTNPHRLRHTCLATANDNTGDLRAVQAFARHARPETTAGYTRATWRRLEWVAQAIDYETTQAPPAADERARAHGRLRYGGTDEDGRAKSSPTGSPATNTAQASSSPTTARNSHAHASSRSARAAARPRSSRSLRAQPQRAPATRTLP